MTVCTHENTRFPERPVPDAWYTCPDCGEKVGRRGGRIITVRENNEIARWQADSGRRYRHALEQIRALWTDPAPAQRQDVAFQQAVRLASAALAQHPPGDATALGEKEQRG